MKVYVTGGMGFIGSWIAMELLRGGHQVTVLARNLHKIPQFLHTPGLSIVVGDVEQPETFAGTLAGHDACIHNALCWDDVAAELQLKDTRASVQLFAACAQAGVEQLIYTSSTAVHRPFVGLMDERARLQPSDHYGATKAAGEAFLSALSHQTSMRCNIIRPGPTVGGPALEGAPVNGDRRFKDIVQAALRNEDIRVTQHDGRQFVGAGDLARLYSEVLRANVNRETYLGVAPSSAQSTFDVGKLQRDLSLGLDSEAGLRDHLRYLINTERTSGVNGG